MDFKYYLYYNPISKGCGSGNDDSNLSYVYKKVKRQDY